MSDYLSRIILEVNGQQIEDFDNYTENEVEYRKPVNLMNKTGFCGATPRYSFTVSYVVPLNGEFDWAEVVDGRVTVEYENGKRITYTGVSVLKTGQMSLDGENAAKRPIDMAASGRIEE